MCGSALTHPPYRHGSRRGASDGFVGAHARTH